MLILLALVAVLAFQLAGFALVVAWKAGSRLAAVEQELAVLKVGRAAVADGIARDLPTQVGEGMRQLRERLHRRAREARQES